MRIQNIPKEVVYYEFVAVIGKVRIKIMIKEIVGGDKFFWSIIPFWKMNEMTKERKLYDDELEYDGNIVSDLQRKAKITSCLMTFVSTWLQFD